MWLPLDNGDCSQGPCARAKHSATLIGGQVYVLGGRGAGGAGSLPLRDFWKYDLGTGKWQKLETKGQHPPSLQEHSAVAHGTRLYVFGGELGYSSTETPLWIFDTEKLIWRKLSGCYKGNRNQNAGSNGTMPKGRRGHSAHSLPDCLLIYGGYQDLKGSSNELWIFHYGSECWQRVSEKGGRTPCAPARHRHASVYHDGRLYVHGGMHDLRECNDMWKYDTMSRTWHAVRFTGNHRTVPSARSGHASVRAGAHLYIFGGETGGRPTNELWRFHFATESWERIEHTYSWPAARVDARALLVSQVPARARSAPAASAARSNLTQTVSQNQNSNQGQGPASGLLREISKLSHFHLRRAARCAYSVLATERDSTESLASSSAAAPMPKSHSAFLIERRGEPREADEAEQRAPPRRSPTLLYLDSDEDERHERRVIVAIPKSASVRFQRGRTTSEPDTETEPDGEAETEPEEEGRLSTSDYASAERVNRLSGTSLGFCNPHYMGPEVRMSCAVAALTPDSGLGLPPPGVACGDIELRDLSHAPTAPAIASSAPARPRRLHMLVVGGRETPHSALLQRPLTLWSYRLL